MHCKKGKLIVLSVVGRVDNEFRIGKGQQQRRPELA